MSKPPVTLKWSTKDFAKGEAIAVIFDVIGTSAADGERLRQVVSLEIVRSQFWFYNGGQEFVSYRFPALVARDLVKRIEALGYSVSHSGDLPAYLLKKAS